MAGPGAFTIDYSEFSAAGFGIHGVILVTRPDGVVVRSLQGLATDPKRGCANPIGAAFLGDQLRDYVDAGRSGLAASPRRPRSTPGASPGCSGASQR